MSDHVRIGIDLGGTKIAGVVLADDDSVLETARCDTPRDSYSGTVQAIAEMVRSLDPDNASSSSFGIGVPGSLSPRTGLMQNANSTWLNNRPLKVDLEQALGRDVRLANDANCFALSEAHDGSAKGAETVFGVIIGTGCGGGIVRHGKIVDGPRGIGGEWGHTPLPSPGPAELPGPACWCGRTGCMETWVSGPAVSDDHFRQTGERLDTTQIAGQAAGGDVTCCATLDRLTDRLARGLGTIINVLDPDVIVLGGGLSSIKRLYNALPDAIAPLIFADDRSINLQRPFWGPASGVRGAARLWD